MQMLQFILFSKLPFIELNKIHSYIATSNWHLYIVYITTERPQICCSVRVLFHMLDALFFPCQIKQCFHNHQNKPYNKWLTKIGWVNMRSTDGEDYQNICYGTYMCTYVQKQKVSLPWQSDKPVDVISSYY